MASFNNEQQKAISAPSDKNILISAGAGSGKTKTLTERVFSLIDQGEVKPSQLLVRTFTNNAAHERKERIVSRFEKAKRSAIDPLSKDKYAKLSDERLSSHVQTFDSFNQYLVSSYASRLGISPNITIADETVTETKKQVLLDGLLKEYYSDPEKSQSLFRLVHSLTTQNDSSIRNIVLDLDWKMESLTDREKKRFFEDYEENFLSDEIRDSFEEDYIKDIKEKIRHELVISYLLSFFYAGAREDGTIPLNRTNSRLLNPEIFSLKSDELPFPSEREQKRYQAYLDLLSKDKDAFLTAFSSFVQDNGELFSVKAQSSKKLFGSKEKGIGFFHRKQILGSSTPLIKSFKGDISVLKEKSRKRKEEISFLLSRVRELESRVSDYKKTSNIFTFADVDKRALSLLTEDAYQDIADEIRERFTYIRVDEYQDTNDAQELFLDALRKTHKDGSRAHIFCVGDAKQSIYGFRNSKVELFRNRQKDYSSNEEHGHVITRNRNYRSQPLLLHQINEIFKKYRTLDHGGIDYQSMDEQLNYDRMVDLYKDKDRKNHEYGISRIISRREDYDGAFKAKDKKEWEIYAIADDIQRKRKDGFLIFDRDIGGKRPVRYSDFGILCRGKKNFSEYQKIFQQIGIPLNSIQEDSLAQVQSVIVIQSLIGLRSYIRGRNPSCQVKHLFASLARSYIAGYDDAYLFKILSYGKDKAHPQGTLDLVKQDPLFIRISQFVKNNYGQSFLAIYDNRINEFGVISDLYKLGNTAVSRAKIESMRSRIVNQQASGEGRMDFLNLRQNRNKYKVELTDKSSISNENAVSLRTIHGSKGLERNVLYRPVLQNKFRGGNKRTKPDYDFSLKYGILLPDYEVHPQFDKDGELIGFPDEEYLPFTYKRYNSSPKDSSEIDEHVRLFYVAVTRAENNLIFVGDGNKEKKTDVSQEDALARLLSLPYQKSRNPLLLKDGKRKDEVEKKKNNLLSLSPSLLEGDALSEDAKYLYLDFYNTYILPYYQEQYQSARDEVESMIGSDYRNEFVSSNPSIDRIASLFAFHYFKKEIKCFSEFVSMISSYSIGIDDDDEDDKDDIPFGIEERKDRNEEEIKGYLEGFANALKDADPIPLNRKALKKQKDNEARINKAFLLSFAYILHPGEKRIEYVTRSEYYCDNAPLPYTIFDFKTSGLKKAGSKSEYPFLYPRPSKENGHLNDDVIDFIPQTRIRASKRFTGDEEVQSRTLDYGTHLHRIRQCRNLREPNLSFVDDSRVRFYLSRVLNCPIRQLAKKSDEYRQEFRFDFDEDEARKGSIDLFFRKDGQYYIVDYKTKDIDDDAYTEQLHVYQHVIEKLYSCSGKDIHLYLLSLMKGEEKEVPCEI